MKKNTNQFNGSHADRINNGGGRFRRIALFPLMLLTLLLLPTRMMAQTDYDNTVTFTALEGNPLGISDAESYHKLFDGQKKEGNSTKWCCNFYSSAYVIFKASKAGIPVGYTITTGNDNSNWNGRNPKSWKLYGNNEGQNGNWTLIQEVNNDTKLQDVNCTSYDFTCEKGKTSYQYFKWEISAIQSGDVLQVGEFELKLQTCTHTNADGSSALGNAIKTVETTCTEHGYTTYKCSICHSIVKKYETDELKKHTLTYHEAKDGVKEHWQCDVCHKYFSDADATQEVSYASLLYQGYAVFDQTSKTLTFSYGAKPEGAYDLNEGTNSPAWWTQRANIEKVVFDASFANARPTSCYKWFWAFNNLAQIEGIEYLNTEKVTNMDWMFSGYSNLPSLDLSNFDTRNVTSMRGMFNACKGIGSLDLSNFNTQNVTDMCCMFWTCSELTSLDLTNFDTQNVEDMSAMFIDCSNLTTIYVGDKFVTTNVSNGANMFAGCEKLKNYTNSKTNHNYANCTTGYFTPGCGYAMFDGVTGTLTFSYKGVKPEGAYELNEGENYPGWYQQASKIKKVVFDASFANARPTSCNVWFFNCSNLTTIEGIEYLNTAKVTNMESMFDYCESLKSLDLTKFNTEKVTNMQGMFLLCHALTIIYASDKFVTDQVTYGNNMFYGCEKLNGYDGSKTNYKYANYKAGYFSKLVGKNGDEKIGASGETLTAASLALGDDKDFVAYEPFSAKAASYSREMKEGTTWATLCLPFEVSLADKNFRAFKLLSANESTSTIQLEEITTSIAAGTPVIIKMNNGETTLSISEANKEIAQKVVSAADGSYLLQGLYTKKVFDKVADNNCYIVKGDKLMNPTKLLENTSTIQVGSKPFRAYMVDNTSSSAGAKMFSIAIGDNTTSIDSLNTIADDKAVYYDLQGNRLSAPQKGINIVKRGSKTMKVIIK